MCSDHHRTWRGGTEPHLLHRSLSLGTCRGLHIPHELHAHTARSRREVLGKVWGLGPAWCLAWSLSKVHPAFPLRPTSLFSPLSLVGILSVSGNSPVRETWFDVFFVFSFHLSVLGDSLVLSLGLPYLLLVMIIFFWANFCGGSSDCVSLGGPLSSCVELVTCCP